MKRIIALFDNHERAVKAGGALLDHGIDADRFDLVGGERLRDRFRSHLEAKELDKKQSKIEHGVTTTTKADAKEGAKKGGTAGIALGAIGGLASLFIPGYGIVVGSGALATAIGTAIGAGAAGVVAGGVTGYLKDMGVDGKVAEDYDETVKKGGAIISVEYPTDGLHESQIREILNKYQVNRIEYAGEFART